MENKSPKKIHANHAGLYTPFKYCPGKTSQQMIGCTWLCLRIEMAKWLRRLTHKLKVRTAEVRIPHWTVWSLSVTLAQVDQSHVRDIWQLRRVDGKISVAPAGNLSLSDFRRLATLNMMTYQPTYLHTDIWFHISNFHISYLNLFRIYLPTFDFIFHILIFHI